MSMSIFDLPNEILYPLIFDKLPRFDRAMVAMTSSSWYLHTHILDMKLFQPIKTLLMALGGEHDTTVRSRYETLLDKLTKGGYRYITYKELQKYSIRSGSLRALSMAVRVDINSEIFNYAATEGNLGMLKFLNSIAAVGTILSFGNVRLLQRPNNIMPNILLPDSTTITIIVGSIGDIINALGPLCSSVNEFTGSYCIASDSGKISSNMNIRTAMVKLDPINNTQYEISLNGYTFDPYEIINMCERYLMNELCISVRGSSSKRPQVTMLNSVLSTAMMHGHFEVTKWLTSMGVTCSDPTDILKSNLDIVKFMIIDYGIPLKYIIDKAFLTHRVDVAEWLLSKRRKIFERRLHCIWVGKLVVSNNISMLKWLIERTTDKDRPNITEQLLNNFYYAPSIEMINFIKEYLGPDWKPEVNILKKNSFFHTYWNLPIVDSRLLDMYKKELPNLLKFKNNNPLKIEKTHSLRSLTNYINASVECGCREAPLIVTTACVNKGRISTVIKLMDIYNITEAELLWYIYDKLIASDNTLPFDSLNDGNEIHNIDKLSPLMFIIYLLDNCGECIKPGKKEICIKTMKEEMGPIVNSIFRYLLLRSPHYWRPIKK